LSSLVICLKKAVFFPDDSMRAIFNSDLTILSGIPGKPAPVPTSASFNVPGEGLQIEQGIKEVLYDDIIICL